MYVSHVLHGNPPTCCCWNDVSWPVSMNLVNSSCNVWLSGKSETPLGLPGSPLWWNQAGPFLPRKRSKSPPIDWPQTLDSAPTQKQPPTHMQNWQTLRHMLRWENMGSSAWVGLSHVRAIKGGWVPLKLFLEGETPWKKKQHQNNIPNLYRINCKRLSSDLRSKLDRSWVRSLVGTTRLQIE